MSKERCFLCKYKAEWYNFPWWCYMFKKYLIGCRQFTLAKHLIEDDEEAPRLIEIDKVAKILV